MVIQCDDGPIPAYARWPWSGPRAVVVRIDGPVDPATVPALCVRVGALLRRVGAAAVVCDVSRLGPPEPAALDAVARVRLVARRLGRATFLLGPCTRLQDLLVITGLAEVLPVVQRPQALVRRFTAGTGSASRAGCRRDRRDGYVRGLSEWVMASDDRVSSEHDVVVRRSFERQVGLFSGPDSPFARRSEGTLAWLEPLTPDLLVLDAACGAAHVAEQVAPRVRQVVGVDLTRRLLDVGAQRLRDAGITNVLLQEGNARGLPFVDASFDLAFCRAALHHMAEPQRAVDELVRVVRPGGRVVLFDLIAPIPDVRDTFDRVHRLIDPSHARAFVEAELPDLLPSGFELTYGATSTMRLPVDAVLTEQSARDEVLAVLRAELEGGEPTGFEPRDEDGAVVVSFTTTVVHAVKT